MHGSACVCSECGCYQLGTVGNAGCDKQSGECRCKRYVTGRQCNECMACHFTYSLLTNLQYSLAGFVEL